MIARIDARVAEGKAVIFLTYHCNARIEQDVARKSARAIAWTGLSIKEGASPEHAPRRSISPRSSRARSKGDQGQRGDRGLTASSIESVACPAYPSSISPLISWEKLMPPSVTVARAGKVSLPLSRPSARAWRTAFSISRWAVTPSALRNFRMLALKTSSFMATSFAPVPAGTIPACPVLACPVVYRLDRHHHSPCPVGCD